jgi:hypothetical protein
MATMPDESTPRSRRALLAAAAGGAAALAAHAALPLTAVAADPNDVVLGIENHSTARTAILRDDDTSGAIAFSVNALGTDSIGAEAFGQGAGLRAGGSGAAGVYSFYLSNADAAVLGTTAFTGVYGYSPADDTNALGTGVWGESPDYGVYGSGGVGVYGFGGIGVIGESASTSLPGILAFGATASSPALEVQGKVKFNRAGRKTIGAGKSSLVVTMAGVTTTSKILAVLNSNRSGRYVRAVVAGSGKFTIYLNSSVSSSTYVAYFVFD